MATRQYGSRGSKKTTNTSPPSSTAPTSGDRDGIKIPSGSSGNILVGTGSLLLLRMLVFGWVLTPVEAIILIALAGFAHHKGDDGQKKLAKWFIGIGLVQFFAPTAITWVQGLHQAQFNPPTPVEEVAPPPEEVPPPSTERVVVSGNKITLTGDGTYSIPKGRKSLCFTNLGTKDGSSNTSQYLTLSGVEYSSLGTECHDLPEDLEGKVIVDFFPGKDYGTPSGTKRLYAYWKSQAGGQSEWPIIRLGE